MRRTIFNSHIGALAKQKDFDSSKFRRICIEYLKENPRYHRKVWEYVYILAQLELAGKLKPGMKGLGFGCGQERLVPVFASLGIDVLATDQAFESALRGGWVQTKQHGNGLEAYERYCPHVCSKDQLEKQVSTRFVDMNNIPVDLMQMQFDFVWSSCSLEHLGSIENGLSFIRNTGHCLKPGGMTVHTTEFNISSNDKTFENEHTVLFRQQDIEKLEHLFKQVDTTWFPVDYDVGDKPIDKYIDLPPYLGNQESKHIKLEIEGYTCTSIGIVGQRYS